MEKADYKQMWRRERKTNVEQHNEILRLRELVTKMQDLIKQQNEEIKKKGKKK